MMFLFHGQPSPTVQQLDADFPARPAGRDGPGLCTGEHAGLVPLLLPLGPRPHRPAVGRQRCVRLHDRHQQVGTSGFLQTNDSIVIPLFIAIKYGFPLP